MTENEVKPKNWHRIDIVAALHKKGLTIKGLSVQAGLSPHTLKNVLIRPYPKGERIIAEALKIEPCEIWPDRYSR